jgi:hypothetical protein
MRAGRGRQRAPFHGARTSDSSGRRGAARRTRGLWRDGARRANRPRAPAIHHCHEQPGWAWQLACVARAPHGVTVPVHVDEVDCQEQPCCSEQVPWVPSAVHAVSVPVQVVVPADQVQPGVVHVDCDNWPQEAIVPVQLLDAYEQPWLAHVDGPSWLHGVIVPEHVVVPDDQTQLFVQASCDPKLLHGKGVPLHVPPPLAPFVHVQPSALHSLW